MDPQVCFEHFIQYVEDGDLDAAYACQRDYTEWVENGGYLASNKNGDYVTALDNEQDRYGISYGLSRTTEVWRDIL